VVELEQLVSPPEGDPPEDVLEVMEAALVALAA
jgi:hypothetical protein